MDNWSFYAFMAYLGWRIAMKRMRQHFAVPDPGLVRVNAYVSHQGCDHQECRIWAHFLPVDGTISVIEDGRPDGLYRGNMVVLTVCPCGMVCADWPEMN